MRPVAETEPAAKVVHWIARPLPFGDATRCVQVPMTTSYSGRLTRALSASGSFRSAWSSPLALAISFGGWRAINRSGSSYLRTCSNQRQVSLSRHDFGLIKPLVLTVTVILFITVAML